MRDHSPTARHPSTPQSRSTAARKRKQIAALTQRLIAESMSKLAALRPTPAPQALEPQGSASVLAALLSAHAPRRL